MCRCKILLCALLLCSAVPAWATPVTYNVTINTSSFTGTAGSLDFNFNPGSLTTQATSLQILGFSSDGALAGTPALTGGMSAEHCRQR